MASTRNKNTPGNYCYQQRDITNIYNNIMYANAPNAPAYTNAQPVLGIIPSFMGRDGLSKNSVDIESALKGINSTNLVEPQKPVVPELITLPPVSYFDRSPLIMPTPLVVVKNQRPFPIP